MKTKTLLYKPDWPDAKKRHEAFWRMEILDRACIAISAPIKEKKPALLPPKDWETYWIDPATWLQTAEHYFASTFFGGEALPERMMMIPYASPYGSKPVFTKDTIWCIPYLGRDWSLSDIRFDLKGRWWQSILHLLAEVCKAAKGRFLVSFPTLLNPIDILGIGLRGPEGLCMDVLQRPQNVKQAIDYIIECWKKQYMDCLSLISEVQDGTIDWLGIWSPKPNYILSCDFSCMISPTLFNKLIKPMVEELSAWLNKPMYHLDGPGAIRHLDALLSILDLGGIQWVPGAGAPPPIEWMPVLKKIQSAGKRLHIEVAPSDVEKAIKCLKPEGLFLSVSCDTKEEAMKVLRTVKCYYKDQR
jgi:hypothetical protein